MPGDPADRTAQNGVYAAEVPGPAKPPLDRMNASRNERQSRPGQPRRPRDRNFVRDQ